MSNNPEQSATKEREFTSSEINDRYEESLRGVDSETQSFVNKVENTPEWKAWVEKDLKIFLHSEVKNNGAVAKRTLKDFVERLKLAWDSAKTEEKEAARARWQIAETILGLLFPKEGITAPAQEQEKTAVPLSRNERMAMGAITGIGRCVRDAVYKVLEWTGLRKRRHKTEPAAATPSNVVPLRGAEKPPDERLAA